MAKRLAVIVSQSPGSNPAKRRLEEDIVTGLMMAPGIDVTVIPGLYDLAADSTGVLALQGINGDLVVCSWLFERASRWILDRNGIRGQAGITLMASSDEDEDEDDEAEEESAETKPRVNDLRPVPSRRIYCLDLKSGQAAQPFIDEILRIQRELSVRIVPLGSGLSANGKGPGAAAMERFEHPSNDTALARDGRGLEQTAPPDRVVAGANGETPGSNGETPGANGETPGANGETPGANGERAAVNRISDEGGRRWYPVIDYSRCTNCLECIDFCLFGVYGIDRVDSILVEQPDNCRKGCPACSRVCPENAIIFPHHKTPAIAGSSEIGASLKIDLSQLFGAPESGKSAAELAAIERDEQLLLAGRQTVGLQGLEGKVPASNGDERRRPRLKTAPRDELDDLVDQLEQFDL